MYIRQNVTPKESPHVIVGDIEQRLIPDISRDLDKAFFILQRVLRYTKGGEGEMEVISRVLEHAYALYMDRNWDLPSLSTFGLAHMENLRFFSYKEVPDHIKEVKAEREWWDGLIWSEPGGHIKFLIILRK
ncbi:hypothetical protein Tco_0026077 [Tanacetum coccineum]